MFVERTSEVALQQLSLKQSLRKYMWDTIQGDQSLYFCDELSNEFEVAQMVMMDAWVRIRLEGISTSVWNKQRILRVKHRSWQLQVPFTGHTAYDYSLSLTNV